uniref:NADH-ubiquinone oxidoreductase chain 6 n=1 Tax=Ochthebius colveranus TaxID=723409 RepID=A0A7H0DLB0_9COLE|nr:NADH dehydrogenase subunit 6 [Ochthebius colveranus]
MISLILTMNLTFSMIFMFMMHPLSMGLILLMQTLLIALISGLMNLNFWFSYILFLIMIGGMLVLFIYMTSIASNEKFTMNFKLFLSTFLFILLIMMMLSMTNKMSIINEMKTSSIFYNDNHLMLTKFFNFPSNMIMFMMIIYLLICLIAVVKITNFNMGPLRQKF